MASGLMTMPVPLVHPSVEDLAAYSDGHLSPAESAEMERHIESCQPCCDTLLGLSSEDTFAALLRHTSDAVQIRTAAEEHDSCTSVRSAMSRNGRYEMIEQIAKGGMGQVFKARHRLMDRYVALKVINEELMRNPEAVERFHREVKAAASLSHPNIVRAYDAEHANDTHFLVMEYVDGITLSDLVRRDGPLPVSLACEYALQTATGLQHAHSQGMVHRDIKPHNLMLTKEGTVKVLDFGLAALTEKKMSEDRSELPGHASLTAVGSLMGTLDFISPEQAADAHQADVRSDIYSLGATLYYLLSGQPPLGKGSVAEKLKSLAELHPPSITRLRNDVGQQLAAVIHRMMSKEPGQRFQTPLDVANALAPFAHEPPLESQVSLSSAVGEHRSRRPRAPLIAMSLGAIGLILSGVLYLVTDKGTLVIESPDEKVDVTISKVADSTGADYLKLTVVDTATGSEVVRLQSGEYKVSLAHDDSQYKLDQGGFTLSRGSKVVVRVTRRDSTDGETESKPLKKMAISEREQQDLASRGGRLSAEEAEKLQKQADANVGEVESRLQLMSYYSGKSILSRELRDPHLKLVLWLIGNYPESEFAGLPYAQLNGSSDPDGYVSAKKLWMETVQQHGDIPLVLGNAARFLQLTDKEAAEDLFRKAHSLDPENMEWTKLLGHLYQRELIGHGTAETRRASAAKALLQFELAMEKSTNAYEHSSLLADAAMMAFESHADEKAQRYASQLLELASRPENKQNNGVAIHSGNLVLGLLAVRNGQIDAARNYLLESGKTTGSPTLNSFGPSLRLANELLKTGETTAVLEYLELCRKFWDSEKLDEWTKTMKNGGTPDFSGDLHR